MGTLLETREITKRFGGLTALSQVHFQAEEGKIAEVPYMWPRPNETEPVEKVVYVTKVGDQVCAVGYYK